MFLQAMLLKCSSAEEPLAAYFATARDVAWMRRPIVFLLHVRGIMRLFVKRSILLLLSNG
jgi:hypothetical protein